MTDKDKCVIKLSKALIKKDRETGEYATSEKTARDGHAFTTVAAFAPKGTVVRSGDELVDVSGYNFDLIANAVTEKELADPEAGDVSFLARADREVRLWRYDRETSSVDRLAVQADALAAAIEAQRKAYSEQRGALGLKRSAPAQRGPRLTQESAAQPMTDRQAKKLASMLAAGLVDSSEIGGVSTKGEASRLISEALARLEPNDLSAEKTPTAEQLKRDYGAVEVADEDIPF